jgi:hypothetical protein
VQFGQEPLELRRIRLPIGVPVWADRLAAGWPVVRDHVFHVSVSGHEFEYVLARSLSEFGAQVDVVPEIINSSDQAFQNERGFIAGYNQLTGVIRQTTALKERKRHFGRAYVGECPGLYPSCAASVTLLLAP